MALDFGRIEFRNARESGVQISLLGSGTYDHIGMFGANGTASAVEVGSYQDTTIIIDSNGQENAAYGPFGGSGFMTNAKNVGDPNTVQLSGLPDGPGVVNIADVNVFNSANLETYPHFVNQSSGTVMVVYEASGTSLVRTYNAKMYAFDNTGTVNDNAPDITIQGFEINASGVWRNSAHSGVWKTMNNRNTALEFADHSAANGYEPANQHLWVAAITVRPEAVGILDDWDIAMELQFA